MSSPRSRAFLKGLGGVSISTIDSVQPIVDHQGGGGGRNGMASTASGSDAENEAEIDAEIDAENYAECETKNEKEVEIRSETRSEMRDANKKVVEDGRPPEAEEIGVVVAEPPTLPSSPSLSSTLAESSSSTTTTNASILKHRPNLASAREELARLPPPPTADELLRVAVMTDTPRPSMEAAAAEAAAMAAAMQAAETAGREYESLDYDRNYNVPYEKVVEMSQSHETRDEVIRWCVTFAIGVATGLVALFIDVIVKWLNQIKFATVAASVLRCSSEGCLATSLLLLVGFNVAFTTVASLFVYMEPCAAGSGIPEIKCYLNGVKMPHVVRLKTLVAKALGVLFSVAGGLFCGKEGPMIHSGAVIGCGIPQFQSVTFKMINFNFPFFRTDRDKRDFVSGGAAAGVAAAFGAPVGGVLFSLEEGSSFWNQALTWRTFFCAMSATFTLNFFLSGIEGSAWGAFNQPGLLSFGEFVCPADQPDCQLWNLYDIGLFVLLGIGGGLLGATFNTLNGDLTRWRMKSVHRRRKYARILEAILIALVTTVLTFTAAMGLGECKKLPNVGANSTEEAVSEVRTFFCEDGYYNDMATLFFNTQEVAIRQLFHQQGIFSIPSLGTFFILFFCLSCWTYGASVPSGLFVPALVCGAAYGRLFGNLLSLLGYNRVYHGTFALMGSAAFLGGVARMTISLTIILIESTNNIVYGLPIMITLMVAKWTGDLFNEGIYDKHIAIKNVPFLEWEAPNSAQKLLAKDVMDVDLVYVYPHTKVRSLVNILKTCGHNAFPVVTRMPPYTALATMTPTTHSKKSSSKISENGGSVASNPTRKESVRVLEEDDFMVSNNVRFRSTSVITRAKEVKKRQETHLKLTDWTKAFGDILMTSVEAEGNNSEAGNDPIARTPTTGEILQRLRDSPTLTTGLGDTSDAAGLVAAVDDDDLPPLTFHGLILRSELVTLLERQIWYAAEEGPTTQWTVNYAEMTAKYPRYSSIHDVKMQEIAKDNIVDLTPYINSSPYTVPANMPVSQVFNLFRSMGLRHLIVINAFGESVGMITRHNLTHEILEHKWKMMNKRKEMEERGEERR